MLFDYNNHRDCDECTQPEHRSCTSEMTSLLFEINKLRTYEDECMFRCCNLQNLHSPSQKDGFNAIVADHHEIVGLRVNKGLFIALVAQTTSLNLYMTVNENIRFPWTQELFLGTKSSSS